MCAILDNAYADGELDADEHRQRCSSAMSAKTRSQLLDLTSDLQTRLPVFAQQPTVAVTTDLNQNPNQNPNQKWIIAGVVGSLLAVVAIVGGVIAIWPSSSSRPPTAPVAAHTQTVSSDTNSDASGTYLPQADVVGTVAGDFQDLIGHAPEHVNCPGNLDGQVGAFERCSIIDKGKHYNADVTVTAVNGTRITTHESINEEVSPAPSSGP